MLLLDVAIFRLIITSVYICSGFQHYEARRGLQRLRAITQEGTNELVQLVTSSVTRSNGLLLDIERANDPQVKSIRGRVVELKKGCVLQLTFKRRLACDLVKNYETHRKKKWSPNDKREEDSLDPLAAAPRGAEIQTAVTMAIENATRVKLVVEDTEWILSASGQLSQKQIARREPSVRTHDRIKHRTLDEEMARAFMQGLGLVDDNGRVRPAKQRKLSQIRQFCEILQNSVSDDVDLVLDAGSGAGYLSFAAHQILGVQRKKKVKIIGIERRAQLVQNANNLARSLGIDSAQLEFICGDILHLASSILESSNNAVVIALHACDTATDEALHAGLSANAMTILVSPCCHKELRPQIDRHLSSLRKNQTHLDDGQLAFLELGRNGLLVERHAETVTDLVRMLLCQIVGYDTQITEWIGTDHTHKNALIIAKRGNTKRATIAEKRRRLTSIARHYGITHQKLAILLGEDKLLSTILRDDNDEDAISVSSANLLLRRRSGVNNGDISGKARRLPLPPSSLSFTPLDDDIEW